MYRRISDFFRELSDETARGDFDKLVERFSFPTVIYIADKVVVIRDSEEFAIMLEEYRDGLDAAGLRGKHLRFNGVRVDTDTGFAVWVTASHVNKKGLCVGDTDMKYYLKDDKGALKVEMIEYGEDVPSPFVDPLLKAAV